MLGRRREPNPFAALEPPRRRRSPFRREAGPPGAAEPSRAGRAGAEPAAGPAEGPGYVGAWFGAFEHLLTPPPRGLRPIAAWLGEWLLAVWGIGSMAVLLAAALGAVLGWWSWPDWLDGGGG